MAVISNWYYDKSSEDLLKGEAVENFYEYLLYVRYTYATPIEVTVYSREYGPTKVDIALIE